MLSAIDKYAIGVFSPDDVRILVAAFDGAWRSLLAKGITFESDRESKAVRDTLAPHIIEQARRGERDQRRLCDGVASKRSVSPERGWSQPHGEAAAAELRKSYVKHSKNDANDAAI